MFKTAALFAVIVAGLAAVPAYAACTYPRAPDRLPDGASSTVEEMVAAQKLVRQFDADITTYTACLQTEVDAASKDPAIDPERLKELDAMRLKKHNAAVDDAQALADRFNEQIRVFKARTKKE